MTFTRLVLHNFGTYRGQHTCDFKSTAGTRPVVLIGGMNGAGKSTIMDAIQLAFFGKMAECSGRRDIAYDEYLRRAVNRAAFPQEARIQLEFVTHSEGLRTVICLDRSWTVTNGRVREVFEVRRNNLQDPVLSESWLEHVDQWFPHGLSQIFFFDGEQLEALADAATSAAVLRASIEGLLGLDLISRLGSDLTVLERRKADAILPPEAQAELANLEEQLSVLIETRSKIKLELGSAENATQKCNQELAELERRVAQEGGLHFDRRHELEAGHRQLESQLSALETQLVELSEGPAPLLLVGPLLERVSAQSAHEEIARQAADAHEILVDRDGWLLARLGEHEINGETVASLRALMEADRASRLTPTTTSRHLGLELATRDTLAGLRQDVLERTRQRVTQLIAEWQETTHAIERSVRQLAAIPSPDTIRHLLTTREERRIAEQASAARVTALRQEVDRLTNQIGQLELAILRHRRSYREQSRDVEDAVRTIEHINRVKSTLSTFRAALLRRHASQIEELALDSLRQLLRKERLVESLRIDPDTFAVSLSGPGDSELPVERLSAGERQLLATALLWGLRRAAGRIVPLVIDTPLGRLDSSHRMHLVTRYFPHASHQTILLSTDEEITGTYYESLRPWIGAEYTLVTNEAAMSTEIRPGYFLTPTEAASVAR